MKKEHSNNLIAPITAGILLTGSTYNLTYFSDSLSNSLPLQVGLGAIGIALLFKTARSSIGLYIFVLLYLITLLAYNYDKPLSFLANPVVPLIVILSIVASTGFYIKNINHIRLAITITIGIIITSHFFQNITFSPSDHITGRSKGFGSGTLYALMAGYVIIYISQLFSRNLIQSITFAALLLVPLWTLYVTQSRGVLLSLIIIAILSSMSRMKKFLKVVVVLISIVLIINLNPQVSSQISILERFQFHENFDINIFTSGRIYTQSTILDWLLTEDKISSLTFGAEGLNGVKTLVSRGAEFPHFDVLYLLYDAGISSVALYLILAYKIIRKFPNRIYFYMFFLSGLHTNMILSPTFLLLSLFFTHGISVHSRSLQNYQPKH